MPLRLAWDIIALVEACLHCIRDGLHVVRNLVFSWAVWLVIVSLLYAGVIVHKDRLKLSSVEDAKLVGLSLSVLFTQIQLTLCLGPQISFLSFNLFDLEHFEEICFELVYDLLLVSSFGVGQNELVSALKITGKYFRSAGLKFFCNFMQIVTGFIQVLVFVLYHECVVEIGSLQRVFGFFLGAPVLLISLILKSDIVHELICGFQILQIIL